VEQPKSLKTPVTKGISRQLLLQHIDNQTVVKMLKTRKFQSELEVADFFASFERDNRIKRFT